MPLKPHHVFGVEPPALFFKSLCGQILGFGTLHVVENEEQRFCRQPLEEVDGITPRRRSLDGGNR